MPDTIPGITFSSDGICDLCHNYEKQKTTDWDTRHYELEKLCDKYRENMEMATIVLLQS